MKEKKLLPSISRVFVKGEGQDEWGNRYFKLALKDSTLKLAPLSLSQISSDPQFVYSELSNAGVNVLSTAAKTQLLNMLQEHESTEPTFKVATRLGWISGSLVRPNKVIGSPKKPVELALGGLDPKMLAKYRVKGSLQEWQKNIADQCTGNSRLMLAVSLAFTGPILRLVSGPRGGGFQFRGPKETGKTTAAMVSGSVWGCRLPSDNPEIGFAESWNSTNGRIEVTALAHNDSLLILDETHLAGSDNGKRAQVVISAVMALAQQNEKQRLTNGGAARWWRCYFLSTSNLTLDELASKGKVSLDDAHRSRLTDVPLPIGGHGIYETLHDFSSGEAMTDALVVRARKFCGSAGLKFQEKIVADCASDEKALRKWLSRRRKKYSKRLKTKAKAKGAKPMSRSTGRCATVYAAGCLASKYGILPWKKTELLKAILTCQLGGLAQAAIEVDAADTSVAGLRKKLFCYLRDNRGQFIDLDETKLRVDANKMKAAVGYTATFKDEKWLYLTADRFQEIVGKGAVAKDLKKELAKAGVIDCPSNGRYVVQRPIFAGMKGTKGHHHVYAFKVKAVDADV